MITLIVSAGFVHRLAPGLDAQPDRRHRRLHRGDGRDFPRGVLPPDRHDPHSRRDRTFRPGALPRGALRLAVPGAARLDRRIDGVGGERAVRLRIIRAARAVDGHHRSAATAISRVFAPGIRTLHSPAFVAAVNSASPGGRPGAAQALVAGAGRASSRCRHGTRIHRLPRAAARRCRLSFRRSRSSSPRHRFRSRSTRPRSMPGPCCWSGRCSISATRSASSRSIPAR